MRTHTNNGSVNGYFSRVTSKFSANLNGCRCESKPTFRMFRIGVVSMGIDNSGLTLVNSSDYVVDLIERFVADLASPAGRG